MLTTVQFWNLARKVEEGLKQALPKLRTTISRKLSLAVAAMNEVRTANTAMLANIAPLKTELRIAGVNNPSLTEQKARERSDPNHGSMKQAYRSMLSWFKRGTAFAVATSAKQCANSSLLYNFIQIKQSFRTRS